MENDIKNINNINNNKNNNIINNIIYKKRLKYKALLGMDGMYVIVHDLEYDAYDQICKVHLNYVNTINKRTYKFKQVLESITLENEEFIFTFNWKGEPNNGDFIIYSIQGVDLNGISYLF